MKKEERIKHLEKLKKFETHEAFEEILTFIEDEDLAVKITAIELLSNFNSNQTAKKALIQLTNDPDTEVRMYSIESLSNFSGDDVEEAVITRLEDPDSLVRMTAAECLGYIGHTKAIPYLCKLISDNNELVRMYTAEALGKLGDRSLIPFLSDRLKIEKRNAARLGFFIGLYLLGEKHFLNSIIGLLKVKSYRVRCATANSLGKLANKDNYQIIRTNLLKALEKEDTIAARSSLKTALSYLDEDLRIDHGRR